MHRTLLIAAIATALSAASAAEAAKRHKRVHAVPYAARIAPSPIQPNAPRWWNGPPTCWSDEGYGRFTSCDNGGKGG
jgi:hypothetical protein